MYLITGATGFLGPHILLELLKRGEQVRALRRSDSSLLTVQHVFRGHQQEKLLAGIEWVEGDVLDPASLLDAMQGINKVIHAAGLVSFDSRDRQALFDINMEGTANMVNAALLAGVQKFLYVSSVAAIGGSTDKVMDEKTSWKDSPLNSVYGNSKYAGEREVWRGMEEGLQVVVVEPAIFLGCGSPEKGGSGIYRVVKNGLRFYPGGSHGYVDTRDVAKACVILTESERANERFVLSVANKPHREVMGMIAKELGIKGPTLLSKPWMLSFFWRWEWLASRLMHRKPFITKELSNTSQANMLYSGEKMLGIAGFAYTPLEVTIKDMVASCQQ